MNVGYALAGFAAYERRWNLPSLPGVGADVHLRVHNVLVIFFLLKNA
jgi:hypothetical protein